MTEPYRDPPKCNHGVTFDEQVYRAGSGLGTSMSSDEVRKRWPRFYGTCQDCGYRGIYYASWLHYVAGDW